MPKPTHPTHGLRTSRTQPLRHRAQLPALANAHSPEPCPATHDFLVPNPRPDLTPPGTRLDRFSRIT